MLSVPSFAQERTFDLMPAPRSLIATENRFRVVKEFSIGIIGEPGDRVYKEATRSLRRLDNRMGFFFKQGNIHQKTIKLLHLLIEVERPAELNLYEDESYELISDQSRSQLLQRPILEQ